MILMPIITMVFGGFATFAYNGLSESNARNEIKIESLTKDQADISSDVALLKYKVDAAIATLAEIRNDTREIKRLSQP